MKNYRTRKKYKIDSNYNIKLIGKEELKRKSRQKSNNDKFISGINLASELGFSIAIPLVLGAISGSYLDKRFDSAPKLTLSLIFLGLIISVYNIFQVFKKNIN